MQLETASFRSLGDYSAGAVCRQFPYFNGALPGMIIPLDANGYGGVVTKKNFNIVNASPKDGQAASAYQYFGGVYGSIEVMPFGADGSIWIQAAEAVRTGQYLYNGDKLALNDGGIALANMEVVLGSDDQVNGRVEAPFFVRVRLLDGNRVFTAGELEEPTSPEDLGRRVAIIDDSKDTTKTIKGKKSEESIPVLENEESVKDSTTNGKK